MLLLAVVAGVGGWYFGMGRYTTTPGVINLTSAQARAKVQAEGLGYDATRTQFSETVAAGSVISTDPGAGSRILKNGTVTAIISNGVERHPVPALRGMTVDQAQRAIEDAHLSYGDSTLRYSEKVATGVVLASDPKPNQELKRGTAIDLVVSKGPHPIAIPNYTGKDADTAERKLTRLGFKVDPQEENDDNVAKGDVISQTPSSKTGFRGDHIALVVSKGPVLIEVPGVKSMGVEDATNTLEAAGFRVETRHSEVYLGLGYVLSQDPGGGDLVARGTLITLSLV